MADYSAIKPGTDLPQYVRDLTRMHDALIGGSASVLRPRALVSRSWSRVLKAGLHPDHANGRDPMPPADIERRRRQSPLSTVIAEILQVISSVADASRFLMVVTDADGVILWREGASVVRRRADVLGFSEGAEWTEALVGTNAIGTSLAEAAPVQLFSAEHFEQAQHPWYCTAFPIHDPRTGELLGIVDVSGPALTLHPAIGALVETAVRLAESQLWRYHEMRLERLRKSAEPIFATAREPMLLVDDNGWVARSAGVAFRDRVGVPQADRALAIPGLGLCVPERLADGWLVRSANAVRTIEARLDLRGAPMLEVRSDGEPWRMSVTKRHAEILVLMQRAGAAGITPSHLSVALFGDVEHLVTARAEVSRLRRSLGAIVASSPYRLADGVTLTVDSPPADTRPAGSREPTP